MGHIQRAGLVDRAVLWPATGRHGSLGQPLLGPPVEIRCRFVPRRSQAAANNADPETVDAQATLDRDVRVGSILWRGCLQDWYGASGTAGYGASGSAGPEVGLLEVRGFNKTSDVRGRTSQRDATLKTWRNDLPRADGG